MDVANTRNSNQGFRRGEIAQTARVGSHPHAHRSQRVARAGIMRLRFERHAPAQRLVKTLALDMIQVLEFELPQTVR